MSKIYLDEEKETKRERARKFTSEIRKLGEIEISKIEKLEGYSWSYRDKIYNIIDNKNYNYSLSTEFDEYYIDLIDESIFDKVSTIIDDFCNEYSKIIKYNNIMINIAIYHIVSTIISIGIICFIPNFKYFFVFQFILLFLLYPILDKLKNKEYDKIKDSIIKKYMEENSSV